MASDSQAYQEKAQAKMDQLNAKIEELKAKSREATADAKIEYQKQIEELGPLRENKIPALMGYCLR